MKQQRQEIVYQRSLALGDIPNSSKLIQGTRVDEVTACDAHVKLISHLPKKP